MILSLIYYGNPLLRTKAVPVLEINQDIKQLVSDMIETMDLDGRGIGLAAPQVGRSLRIFVLRKYLFIKGRHSLSEPVVYINPEINIIDEKQQFEEEGCLSIPGIKAKVGRPSKLIIKALDLNGKSFSEEVEGYNARVILHENDHLEGVLFVDKLEEKERAKISSLLNNFAADFKN
ncbi:MAG: peptide deformylase [Rhabdochlamydiaceae bacterium]